MNIDQTVVYELASVDGDHVILKTTITQAAADQQIQNPAMPGMKMDLVKLSSKGTGEITADLTQLLPPKSTMKMQNESSMSMGSGDQKTAMSMKMDLNLIMETK